MFLLGWSTLNVETIADYDDMVQAHAAGYVEAYLTQQRIYYHAYNYFVNYTMNEALRQYVNENRDWMEKQIKDNQNDEVWYQVGLMLEQEDALQAGYAAFHKEGQELNPDTIKYMMYFGDYSDLVEVLNHREQPADHCSALIKVLEDFSDIYIAQESWYRFNTMTRIWKVYDFPYHKSAADKEIVPGRRISMASYPTYLYSFDDFYMLSQGLVVQETTIGNSNTSLYNQIQSNQLSVWMRTMLANRLSTNGENWGEYYGKYNNGLYCNQYMVLNMNLFTPGEKELKDGLLWVTEQIPGYNDVRDLTYILRNQSYYPSYNSAMYPEIRVLSNATGMEKVDDYYTYDKNPRAKIFKRDQGNIKDLPSMRRMMRYNDFKNDEFSKCNCTPAYTASFAISMRGDLNDPNGIYPVAGWGLRNHAGLDVKLTSYTLYKRDMSANIISGPTYDQQPAFVFSKSPFSDLPHLGLPDEWKFPWYEINSKTMDMNEMYIYIYIYYDNIELN